MKPIAFAAAAFAVVSLACHAVADDGLRTAQSKVVKVFGAGGLGRIEGYGTGILVSADGHVLTALSPLLESSPLQVVLADGRRTEAAVVAIDSARQLAIVKTQLAGLPHFELDSAVGASAGDVVFALSNCFGIAHGGEEVSIQRGRVAVVTRLNARQGFFRFSYPGEVLIVDTVINNPGSAGGALVNAEGRLVGVIGKEVQNDATLTWVNFAIPVASCNEFVSAVLSGTFQEQARKTDRPASPLLRADLRGVVPLPDVLDKTPPFVDRVIADSPAHKAGVMPDDLILFIGNELIQSLRDLNAAMHRAPADKPVTLVVLRGEDLVTLEVPPPESQ